MDNAREPGDLRFMVIGCGSIGKRHIENLRALGARDILACDGRALTGARKSAALADIRNR